MIDPSQTQKVAGCASIATQHATFDDSSATTSATSNATNSLKALAGAVLERNTQRNASATKAEKQCNKCLEKTDEKLRSVAPDFIEKNASEDKLKPEDRTTILRWLRFIGETDQAMIDDVLDYCAGNPEALAYYLKRAEEALSGNTEETTDGKAFVQELVEGSHDPLLVTVFMPNGHAMTV